MSNQQNFGRTFFDFISEHPKKTFAIFIAILIVIFCLKIPIKYSGLEINSDPKIVHDTIIKELIKTDTIHINSQKPIVAKKLQRSIKIEDSVSKISVQNQPANINTGTNNGIIGNNNNLSVKVDEKQRKLSDASKQKLMELINQVKAKNKGIIKSNHVNVLSITGSREALIFATEIQEYLKSENYEVGNSIGQFQRDPVINGVLVDFNSFDKLISIYIGY